MAGIGLELKKIYSKNNLSNLALGAAYSSMITVGPTLIIVVMLLILYSAMGFNNVDIALRELLSSTILYIFVFSGIIIAPFSALFSRYIADKIYQEKFSDILPSYYTGLAVVCLVSTLASIPIIHNLVFLTNLPVSYAISTYAFWMSMVVVYFSTIYIHATKDYRIVFIFYLIGLGIGFLLSYIFGFYFETVYAIMYGLTIGFFLIAFLQFTQIKRWFSKSSKNYTECLIYFWKFKTLFISNALYSIGIYAHIFIFWFAADRIVIWDTFLSHPMYDMAACIAMICNISTVIFFIVMAETEFHDAYQNYMQAIVAGTFRLIQENKRIMFKTLTQQLTRLINIQSVITAILFLVGIIFLPQLFFSSIIIEIFPILSLGYFILYLMYCVIIYLYYFNDQIGCLFLSCIFLIASCIGTYYSSQMDIMFYGLGFLFGSLCGFTFGFFRIKYIEKVIDKHIFCDKIVVKKTKRAKKQNVVYTKNLK